MVKLYINTDENNYVIGYGKEEYGPITSEPKNSFLISVKNDHEILTNGNFNFKLVEGKLIKDDYLFKTRMKNEKNKELNDICQSFVIKGFDFQIKGNVYHFNYDQETQLNFQDTYNLFQNNLLEEIGWTARLNEKKVRIQLTKKIFFDLYTASIKHKNECLNHLYDDLLVQLEKADTKEAIEAIQWGEFGENLTFNTQETLDKKLTDVDMLGKETQAQKGQNAYMESTIMEVADLIFGSM